MIHLGDGVCSDQTVNPRQWYLARQGFRYLAIMPKAKEPSRMFDDEIPYTDAIYWDSSDHKHHLLTELSELHPIH